MPVLIVGPGGAGRSTAGPALAARLGVPFVDLDKEFAIRVGDISVYLTDYGYDAYAARNIQVCLDMLAALRRGIARSPTTVVLLPSFDYETCVAETVRRS
jgi:shikimate kinase